jgi:hypothetical protein
MLSPRFFYRKEVLKTTWTFRLLVLVCVLLLPWLTRSLWFPAIERGLVCQQEEGATGEAMLLENFDVNYLIFERAAELRQNGMRARILVPVQASSDPAVPNIVSAEIVAMMARVARLGELEMIPIREIEPISLNAAYQIRDYLQRERIHSILVVTPAFRSRRSSIVYRAVLGPAGIHTACMPIFGGPTPVAWSETWHGVEQVVEQYVKLGYYRVFVLPRVAARSG